MQPEDQDRTCLGEERPIDRLSNEKARKRYFHFEVRKLNETNEISLHVQLTLIEIRIMWPVCLSRAHGDLPNMCEAEVQAALTLYFAIGPQIQKTDSGNTQWLDLFGQYL